MEYSIDEYNCVPSKKKDSCGSGAQHGTPLTEYKVTGRCVKNESSAIIPKRKNKKRQVSSHKSRKKNGDEMHPLLAPENPASSTYTDELQSPHSETSQSFYRKCMHFLFPKLVSVSDENHYTTTYSARLTSGVSSTSRRTGETLISAKRTRPSKIDKEIFVRSRIGFNVTQIYFPESGQIFKPE